MTTKGLIDLVYEAREAELGGEFTRERFYDALHAFNARGDEGGEGWPSEAAFMDEWMDTNTIFFAWLRTLPESEREAAWREAENRGFSLIG